MKIGILYICTGKYNIFWKDFYLSCEKNFIIEADKHYFVFTDSPEIEFEKDNKNIHRIYQENLGWPNNTLKRYEMFLKIKSEIEKTDYLIFFNANLLFIEPITAQEFLPNGQEKLVGCLHPGFYGQDSKNFPFETDPLSRASLDISKRKNYYQGAVNGGETKYFIKTIETIDKNISDDSKNNIIAIWHDESHWNWYLNNNLNIVKTLSPSYLFPENSHLPFTPKIFMRNKDQFGSLGKIRDIKNKLSKTFILDLVNRIKVKIIYTSFRVYDYIFYSKKGIYKYKKTNAVSERRISVVITYYNRHETIHKALYTILGDERVGEILIVDDCSKENSFEYLKNFIKKLNNPKIKIIKNVVNLGMYKNKIHAISLCSYDWVILLDSDNTLTKAYLDAIFSAKAWDLKTMYCPSFAWPLINNEALAGKKYDLGETKKLLTYNSIGIKRFLNLGNFFVNKNEFISSIKDYTDCLPFAADSIFINYVWLAKNGTLYIPKNCRYVHRVNPDSTWSIQNAKSTVIFENIKNAILILEKDPKKVVQMK